MVHRFCSGHVRRRCEEGTRDTVPQRRLMTGSLAPTTLSRHFSLCTTIGSNPVFRSPAAPFLESNLASSFSELGLMNTNPFDALE
jgi:hypothetical protein